MSKTAYISPSTGELEINIIKDATPRVVINLDLGIPNFTVFSMKFPLVTEEPKNMAVVIQEALGVLLDEVATFMMSLRFDQAVITDVYARALSCFAGMTMESSTQADYDKAGQDPTMNTYQGTFILPQSFVQETQKRVVTGASFVKRVPKQRVVEFVKAVPVNKNTIDDAKRTIQMYKNRQLKTQPKPLYVLVYDMNGNPTGVLPVDQQWKSKLLRKIQSWQKRADDPAPPTGPVVVDQEYNGKGVDTSGTQKFTGVRPQVPLNNPGVAGTSTASAGSDWQWGTFPGVKNKGIGTPKYPAASKLVDEMMEGNIPPMDNTSYSYYIKAYQEFMENHEDLVRLANEAASKMSEDEIFTVAAGEETDQKKVVKKYGKPGQAASKLLNELFDGEEVATIRHRLEDAAPKKKKRQPEPPAVSVEDLKEYPKVYKAIKKVVGNAATMEVAFPGGFGSNMMVLMEQAEYQNNQEALKELLDNCKKFLRRTGIIASAKRASAPEKNGAVGKEVYDAMEKRCFNLDSESEGEAVYERHDGDIRVKVHFNGQEIGDVELNLSDEKDGRWSDGNTDKKQGWDGIKSFTNTYGD
jgi:hypothetical protein